jgi:hypothetical protein
MLTSFGLHQSGSKHAAQSSCVSQQQTNSLLAVPPACHVLSWQHHDKFALQCGRDACLRQQGFTDVFAAVKAEENAKALDLLPGVLQ